MVCPWYYENTSEEINIFLEKGGMDYISSLIYKMPSPIYTMQSIGAARHVVTMIRSGYFRNFFFYLKLALCGKLRLCVFEINIHQFFES